MERDLTKQTWLTEPEAAEYCRCSLRSFRRMALPANDSGGRKVYRQSALDAAIEARPWKEEPPVVALPMPMPANLTNERLRPFKARKRYEAAPDQRAADAAECSTLWNMSPDHWLRTVACKPTFPKRVSRKPATWIIGEVLEWRNANRAEGRRQ